MQGSSKGWRTDGLTTEITEVTEYGCKAVKNKQQEDLAAQLADGSSDTKLRELRALRG